MRRCGIMLSVLTICCFIASICGLVSAQDEAETYYSYGTVSSVSLDKITVAEYDYSSGGEDINVTYIVGSDTELNNVGSLTDIAVGNNVEIEYIIKDGEKVAKTIKVETTASGNESEPLETYEE